jgi:hypothetical protein
MIPRLSRIARDQDPWIPTIAAHKAAAHVSQSQKKGGGANFNIRSEAAIALKASDTRKRDRRALCFATHWPLESVDV